MSVMFLLVKNAVVQNTFLQHPNFFTKLLACWNGSRSAKMQKWHFFEGHLKARFYAPHRGKFDSHINNVIYLLIADSDFLLI